MVIAVYNLKGGVGKTTLVWALSAILAARGLRVLCVDLDSQCNLTYCLCSNTSNHTIYDAMIHHIVKPVATAHWGDIIPGSIYIDSLPDAAGVKIKRTLLLRSALAMTDIYDITIIDCPPGINLPNSNALHAADYVITPTHLDAYSLQGVHTVSQVISQIKRSGNARLVWAGIAVTDWRPRLLLTKHLSMQLQQAAKAMGTHIYASAIKHATKINELILNRQPLTPAAGDCYTAYDCLTDNVLDSIRLDAPRARGKKRVKK